jgi:hypothetical protein
MKKFRVLVLVLSTLAINLVGINFSQAVPTTKALTCSYSSNSDLVLAYGVNSVTITNPNGCNTFGSLASLQVAFGSGSTWTYSKTIGGVTTSGAYDTFGGTFRTGSLGTGDSFTMNLTSATSDQLQFYNDAQGRFMVNFNSQVESFNPSPVVIGQQVTVTGSNLSSVTSLILSGPAYFGVTTSNRTATQLTFIMPATYTSYYGGTRDVTAGTYSVTLGGTNVELRSLIAVASPAVTAPGAPTIGTATALSPTSASISFTAPTSDGGATIETYTATSTPGSITGRVLQSGSGSITITGLTPSTVYTFSVTASNSAGTSSASGATVSITMPANQAEIDAAAFAAQKAAEAKREAEKKAARTEITKGFSDSKAPTFQQFATAEISGVTEKNLPMISKELMAMTPADRSDIKMVEMVSKKYRILDAISQGDKFSTVTANDLSSVGLIPKNYQTTVTNSLRSLPASQRDDYTKITAAINEELAVIRIREERLASILALRKSRQAA